MKKMTFLSLFFGMILGMGQLQAQFDDLYYNPDTDDDTYYYDSDDEDYYQMDDPYYDDDEYEDYQYYSDYDGYYSSRIRRFRDPYFNFGFYSALACNSFWYDPFDFYYSPYAAFGYGGFYSPGSFISIGFGFPSYYGFGYGGNWGHGHFHPYYRPNNFYNSCVAFNGPFYGGYFPGYYGGGHHNGWYGGHYNNNHVVNNNPKGTYYGSRRGGSTSSSVKGTRETPRVNPRESDATQNEVGVVGRDNVTVRTEENEIRRSDQRTRESFGERDLTSDRPTRKSIFGKRSDESPAPSVRRAEERRNNQTQRSFSERNEQNMQRSARPSRQNRSNLFDRNSNNNTSRRNNSFSNPGSRSSFGQRSGGGAKSTPRSSGSNFGSSRRTSPRGGE